MALRRRRLLMATAAIVAWATLPGGPARALPAAADVARRYADAIVVVEAPCPATTSACTPGRSQGFAVSSNGLFATVLPGVKPGDVVLVRGEGDAATEAAVIIADPDGLALVRLQAPPSSPLTALAVGVVAEKSRWLIGLAREARGVQAVVGGDEPQGLLVPVPRGAPILNEAHAVVAVATRSRGGGAIDVVPADRVRRLAARMAQQAADGGHTRTSAGAP